MAVYLNPEILLIDEVLNVGDLYFQQKAKVKIKEIQQAGTTLVIVSHDLKTIEDMCDKTILFKEGKITNESKSAGVVKSYIEGVTRQVTQIRCKIKRVSVKNELKKLIIMVHFQFDEQINEIDYAVAASITQKDRNMIAQRSCLLSGTTPRQTAFALDTTLLPTGVYNLAINLTDKDVTRIYAQKKNIYPFRVNKDSSLTVGKNIR